MNHPSRIIVVGASAGGVEALKILARGLPADLPAAVFAVMHIPAHVPSLLGPILRHVTALTVLEAEDGLPIRAGHIYVGVSDRHLLVDGDVMRVTRGPKENRFRPSIDTLFRSAAYTQGARAVGVVLTGQLDDGTSGLWAIKDRGGVTIVQSPRDAEFPSMPMNALEHVSIDHVVDLATLPSLLTQLASEPLPSASGDITVHMRTETEIAAGQDPLQAGSLQLGKPTRFTCPECHGTLSEMREGSIVRFRCHTGHAFTMQALLAEVDDSVDEGLWSVFRTMQERSLLLREAADLARQRNEQAQAEVLESRAMDCEDKGRVVRALLQDPDGADGGKRPDKELPRGRDLDL